MVVSSYRGSVGVLPYLTVFRSRLGAINLVLRLTGFRQVPDATLLRRLRTELAETLEEELDGGAHDGVLEYLTEKKLVGAKPRQKGRYPNITLSRTADGWVGTRRGEQVHKLRVFKVDAWMASSCVPSTVGAPTPENASEIFELAIQLGVLSPAKNTWTAVGQMLSGLWEEASVADDNPFLLGTQKPGYMAQILRRDGLVLRELLRWLDRQAASVVRRDDVAEAFDEIVAASRVAFEQGRPSPRDLRAVRELETKMADAVKAASTNDGSAGPGVLEHRVAPRLEWLCDLGYLRKPEQRNQFTYEVGPSVARLLRAMDEVEIGAEWADGVVYSEWPVHEAFEEARERMKEPNWQVALVKAYRLMQRRIGPAPLREVAFVTNLGFPTDATPAMVKARIVDLAKAAEGATAAGGRYSRAAESVYFPDSVLETIGQGGED